MKKKKILFLTILIILSIRPIYAESWCKELNSVWTLFGYILKIAYVLTPVLLILTGSISLLTAMVNKDDSAIKKAQQVLIKKIIAAVAVFLVITITNIVLSLVASDVQNGEGNWTECAYCFLKPGEGDCTF